MQFCEQFGLIYISLGMDHVTIKQHEMIAPANRNIISDHHKLLFGIDDLCIYIDNSI